MIAPGEGFTLAARGSVSIPDLEAARNALLLELCQLSAAVAAQGWRFADGSPELRIQGLELEATERAQCFCAAPRALDEPNATAR